jgi:hypothetical protein
MSLSENPRAVVGDNQAPDYAQRVTDQMARDYAALTISIAELLDKARAAAVTVSTDEEAIALGIIVKDLRDAFNRADAYRTSEKEPFLRSEQAVDAFFFQWMEKCRRRNPRDRSQKPGAADILQARIDDFLERKRIAEEERRRLEAEETARVARAAAAEQARLAAEAEEARLAAERARKPETVAVKEEVATKAEEAASAATVEANVAQEKAQDAHIATLAPAAEMVRTRGEGVLLTQAKENYAIMVDRSKLDMAKLAPFFTDAEVEKALRGWAKTTGYNQPMDGAEIGRKNKGVTR